jgi:hypothetical protein
VAPIEPSRPLDPELDRPRPEPAVLQDPEALRLLANPFLALLGLLVWAAGLRYVVEHKQLVLLMPALAAGAGLVFLLQYHCLDCGATGWLFRWRNHACAPMIARGREGRRHRFRATNPIRQLVIWFYVLLVVAFLAAIVVRANRAGELALLLPIALAVLVAIVVRASV